MKSIIFFIKSNTTCSGVWILSLFLLFCSCFVSVAANGQTKFRTSYSGTTLTLTPTTDGTGKTFKAAIGDYNVNKSSITQIDIAIADTFVPEYDLSYLFEGWSALESISGLQYMNTEGVYYMINIFSGCSSLTSLDLSSWDTEKMVNGYITGLFDNCNSLTKITLSDKIKSAILDQIPIEFYEVWERDGKEYRAIPQNNGYAKAGTYNKKIKYYGRFSSSLSNNVLTLIPTTDGNGKTFKAAIGDYSAKMSSITKIDIAVTDTFVPESELSYLFYNWSALESISGLQYMNTENITEMHGMFLGCLNLTSLDLSGWNTSKVYYMHDMFLGCSNLTSLDLSGWNTEGVNYMNEMFYNCSNLTSLDLSGWNTKNVYYMNNMFYNCNSLTKIILSDKIKSAISDQILPVNKHTNSKCWVNNIEYNSDELSSIPTVNNLTKAGTYYAKYTVTSSKGVSTLPEGGYMVFNGDVLTFDEAKHYDRIEMKEGSKITLVDGVDLDASIVVLKTKNDRYYFISLPYDCNLNEVTLADGSSAGTYGNDWAVVRYDGAKRATDYTTIDNKTSWAQLGADDVMEAGVGYNIAVGYDTEVELVFPMANGSSIVEAKAAAVAENAGTGSTPNEHKGWNLISHSYLKSFNGTLSLGGSPINYLMTFNGSSYDQVEASTATLKPFSSFFVQVGTGGDVAFGTTTQQNAAPRSMHNRQRLAFTITSNDTINNADKTTLLLDDDNYSVDYEIGQDFIKFLTTSTVPQIYSNIAGRKHAFNAIPESELANITIGYYAPRASEYHISLSQNMSNYDKVYLHDNVMNVTHNLLTGDYVFTATDNEQEEDRFSISAQQGVTTDNHMSTEDKYVVSTNEGIVTVEGLNEGSMVHIYNAAGQMLYSNICNSKVLSVDQLSAGVYLMSVINAGEQELIKFIVK